MYDATNMRLDASSDSKETLKLQNPWFLFFFEKLIMPSSAESEKPYLNSKHALAKIIGLVLGINTLFVTYYIHYDSPWHSQGLWLNCSMVEKLQEHNQLEWIAYGLNFKMTVDHCPGITMERFLLGTNFIILTVSGISFFCCCWANLETVNAIRGRESFYNVASGIIILIGAVLFAVSTAKISQNKCETKMLHEDIYKTSKLCDIYFLDNNKYVAAILGFIQGVYLIALACLLDNMKLFGMKKGTVLKRREQASQDVDLENNDSGQINGGGGSGRKSNARSLGGKRRSSLVRKGKGIGSFGAVTTNMTTNTSSKLQKSSSLQEARKSRKSVMPRTRDNDHDVDKNASSGMINS